jgi:hypothetical protein
MAEREEKKLSSSTQPKDYLITLKQFSCIFRYSMTKEPNGQASIRQMFMFPAPSQTESGIPEQSISADEDFIGSSKA